MERLSKISTTFYFSICDIKYQYLIIFYTHFVICIISFEFYNIIICLLSSKMDYIFRIFTKKQSHTTWWRTRELKCFGYLPKPNSNAVQKLKQMAQEERKKE